MAVIASLRLGCSADEVLVVIKINSETITNHRETVLVIHHVRLWQSRRGTSIIRHGKLLELLHSTSCTIFLSVLDRVIFLWHLETDCRVAENDTAANYGAEDHDNLRSLILEMHCRVRVWQFIVEVLILETDTVHIVILHVVVDGQVVVDIASTVNIIRSEIEPDIVPVRWHVLVHGQGLVSEVV